MIVSVTKVAMTLAMMVMMMMNYFCRCCYYVGSAARDVGSRLRPSPS